MPHPIVHLDIPAKNVKESAEFYSRLFDWTMHHDEAANYTMFQPESGPGGGFMPSDSVSPSSMSDISGAVIFYVDTDDIEGTLARAEELGAKTVVGKTNIGPNGWWAAFQDPSGNNIGLYTGPSTAS